MHMPDDAARCAVTRAEFDRAVHDINVHNGGMLLVRVAGRARFVYNSEKPEPLAGEIDRRVIRVNGIPRFIIRNRSVDLHSGDRITVSEEVSGKATRLFETDRDPPVGR